MPVFNNTDELVTDAMQLDGNSGCCWLNIFVGGSYVHYRAKRLSSGRRADTSLSSVSASTSGSNTQSPF